MVILGNPNLRRLGSNGPNSQSGLCPSFRLEDLRPCSRSKRIGILSYEAKFAAA